MPKAKRELWFPSQCGKGYSSPIYTAIAGLFEMVLMVGKKLGALGRLFNYKSGLLHLIGNQSVDNGSSVQFSTTLL